MSSEFIKELKEIIKEKEEINSKLINNFELNKLKTIEDNQAEDLATQCTKEFIKNINLNNKKLELVIDLIEKMLD